jgi:L-threonylcarbamoyladenylate synthase
MTNIINYTKEPNRAIDTAIEYLHFGKPIVFPTETVYGLGAAYDNADAIAKIYEIKNREGKKPLALHIANLDGLEKYVKSIPENFYKLAEKFLPGPLAIIMEKTAEIGDYMTSGFDSVSIRYPDNKVALKLIDAFGKPLAATSVNISGEPDLLTAEDIYKNFEGVIPFILDAGKSPIGVASTVISLTGNDIQFLRIGSIPKEDILKVVEK